MRLTSKDLHDEFSGWNAVLRTRVHIIACGGTALTLQDIKESTKDVDLMVPKEREFDRLIKELLTSGYTFDGHSLKGPGDFEFDLFRGNKVHTTELLDSPLDQGRHIPIREWSRLYLGALNDYDLIISKMFRGHPVDVQDCADLVQQRGSKFDFQALLDRYYLTAQYDINPTRMWDNLNALLMELDRRNLNVKEVLDQYRRWPHD